MSLELINKVNIKDKLNAFSDHWTPRIVGELNGQHVKLVKAKGDFVMHKHEDEDEMFLIVEGQLLMELKGKSIELNPGEFLIIPKGVEHKPIALKETTLLLFEPISTLNTGNVVNNLTVKNPIIE